jgi:hypothetical protein
MSDAGMVLGSGEAAAIEMIEHTFGKGNRASSAGFIQPPTARCPDRTQMDGEIAAAGRVPS